MNLSSNRVLSLFTGAGALAVTLSLLGMASPNRASGGGTESLLVELAARPQNLVRIIEGDSYVVPLGKILVIRTLADALGASASVLKIDGQNVLSREYAPPMEYVLGVAANAGQTVTIEDLFPPDPSNTPIALGFLVDA